MAGSPIRRLRAENGVHALRDYLRAGHTLPLEVMLEQMRFSYEKFDEIVGQMLRHMETLPERIAVDPEVHREYVMEGYALVRGLLGAEDRAVFIAAKAAPFCHPTWSGVKLQDMRDGGDDGSPAPRGARIRFVRPEEAPADAEPIREAAE